jgi:hypothetical protein
LIIGHCRAILLHKEFLRHLIIFLPYRIKLRPNIVQIRLVQ